MIGRAVRTALTITAGVVLMLGGFGDAPAALGAADAYPTRTITIYTPFAAGSTNDIEARVLALGLRDVFHQPVIVVNAPGASGGVALTQVETRPADGYSLLLDTRTLSFILASGDAHYAVKDVAAIVRLDGEALSLFVRSSSPFRSLADFVQAAKASPGKLVIGGPGVVEVNHQAEVEFADAAGIDVAWVPFAGGGQVVTAVLGGHLDAGMTAPSNALGNVQAGTMRYLALAAKPPYTPLPTAPTFTGAGYPLVEYVWRGVVTRSGVPDPVLARLATGIDTVRHTAAWAEFEKKYAQVDLFLGPSAFQTYLEREVEATAAIAKRLSQGHK
ncbi:MAG TPA: tripartite tricarboxylate transporter substrate binding protein [bacterium]|nr:tripartite tricarboxylate transporter substrate binding protein [bacterium]